MKISKRPMTLVELLIAVALLSVVLFFLLGAYKQMGQVDRELREARKESFEITYTEFRLASTLPKSRVIAHAISEKSEDFFFYISDDTNRSLKGPSLVFVYDRGVDIVPEFSGAVLARLYLDNEKRLCFAQWPLPSRWEKDAPPPMRKEILLDKVAALSFEFYTPPPPADKPVDPERVNEGKEKIESPEGWQPHWDKQYEGLPPLVKVHIIRDTKKGVGQESYTFAYILQNSRRTILYQK